MPYPESDCVCVQGIEHLIDPRPYYPQWDTPGPDRADLPIWERNMLRAMEAKAAAEAEAEADALAASGGLIDPERVLKLVAQRNLLINQGYTKLVAYQINSFYVQLSSVDQNWVNRDVSLIVQHPASGRSVNIPILELGSPVLIKGSVLLPGTLKIAAIAVCREKDNYSVITTEALTLKVYDPGIGPIQWPKMKDYDLYLQYQNTAKNLLSEVKEIKELETKTLTGTVTGSLICTKGGESDRSIDIPYYIMLNRDRVFYAEQSLSITDLTPTSGYTLKFSMPLTELGIDDVSDDTLDAASGRLAAQTFVQKEARDGKYVGLHSDEKQSAVSGVKTVFNFPAFRIDIPAKLAVVTFNFTLPNIVLLRG